MPKIQEYKASHKRKYHREAKKPNKSIPMWYTVNNKQKPKSNSCWFASVYIKWWKYSPSF